MIRCVDRLRAAVVVAFVACWRLATDDGHRTTLVKSRIGVGIRRNSNSLLTSYDDYVLIKLGFVCHILAVFALRARVIAELGRGAGVAEKRRVLGAAFTRRALSRRIGWPSPRPSPSRRGGGIASLLAFAFGNAWNSGIERSALAACSQRASLRSLAMLTLSLGYGAWAQDKSGFAKVAASPPRFLGWRVRPGSWIFRGSSYPRSR